ncbi:MAG TPA: lipoprotein [Burkholderiales bacterium]|jgi:predicted small lipoprotein YifL|nr:lipoprotein [Burkholderiales bacterium]
MVPRSVAIIIIIATLMLAGCGIKGPLRLPPGKTAPEPTGLPPGAVPPTTLPPKAPDTTPETPAPETKDSTQ